MSQVVAMAGRLQDAENTIAELRAALEQASHRLEEDSPGKTPQDGSQSSHINSPVSATTRSHNYQNTETSALTRVDTDTTLAPEEELISDLSLDQHGKVSWLFNSA